LSSAVLEFFTSISIALTAVYFGFAFIGELNFGDYGAGVTLFAGIFILVLAPEFYQPLRDLGTFYHAKQQAVGAAESIVEFLETDVDDVRSGSQTVSASSDVTIKANDLQVFSPEGTKLLGPVSFELCAKQTTALVGPSGAGKTSLINAILGFLPYQGSLTINGIERSEIDLASWRENISWVGQNPLLLHGSIRDNITLGKTQVSDALIHIALQQSFSQEFVDNNGLDYQISDRSSGLSVGQAQRLALARAMVQNGQFWLLDEPTASLDARSEKLVMQGLETQIQGKTALMVTHQLSPLKNVENILVMQNGQVVQSGPYSELALQDGLFKQMLESNQALSQSEKGNLDA
jgi:ATP-binding cassette subfamily C protein CydD